MKVTIQDVLNLKPCYTSQYLQALWQGKESLALQEIAGLDISDVDRIWVLIRLMPNPENVVEKAMSRYLKAALEYYTDPAALEAIKNWPRKVKFVKEGQVNEIACIWYDWSRSKTDPCYCWHTLIWVRPICGYDETERQLNDILEEIKND